MTPAPGTSGAAGDNEILTGVIAQRPGTSPVSLGLPVSHRNTSYGTQYSMCCFDVFSAHHRVPLSVCLSVSWRGAVSTGKEVATSET